MLCSQLMVLFVNNIGIEYNVFLCFIHLHGFMIAHDYVERSRIINKGYNYPGGAPPLLELDEDLG